MFYYRAIEDWAASEVALPVALSLHKTMTAADAAENGSASAAANDTATTGMDPAAASDSAQAAA